MFKYLLSLLICILPYETMSSSYVEKMRRNDDVIYNQIVRHVKGISIRKAVSITNAIRDAERTLKLNGRLYLAMMIQESQLKLETINCHSNGCDFGIAQVNYKTANNFNFDKVRLLTDLDYSVISGAKVLADFKRMYGHKEKEYWTRYHSSNPELRKQYKELVTRFL